MTLSRVMLPLRSVEKNLSLPLPSFDGLPTILRIPWVATLSLCLYHLVVFSLCVSLSLSLSSTSYKDTSDIGLRAHPTPV